MRIILLRELNPFFDSSASGNRFASLVKGLSQQGVEMSVVVTGGYNNPEEKRVFGKRTIHQGVEIEYLSTALNHTLWRRRLNKYLLSHLTDRIIALKLQRVLKKKYDYIWLTSSYPILGFFNRNKNRVRRSILEINEFHDIYKTQGNLTNRAQEMYARRVEANFLDAIQHVDCFAVMTTTLLNYHKKIAKPSAKFLHLPMTVDMSRFAIEKSNEKVDYIAFAGSLNNLKDGADILIESFADISDKFPELELHIAGECQPDVDKQREVIKQRGLTNRVKYVGLLSREQIPRFLVDATILALPRPDSHQAQGGFPTKLGEYLSTKNPVCATKVGEIPQYLQDNISAFMATAGDTDSFTDALLRALSDKDNARKVAEGGYMVAKQNFNMEVQARRLKFFLENNIK